MSNLVALNKARARPLEVRFWERVQKTRGCWTWAGARNRHGYGTVNYDGTKPALAHRVAWELTMGPIPTGMRVLHRCDNPTCVRPHHLFLGTQADNVHDMDDKGRRVNAGQKITVTQLDDVRRRLAAGESQTSIAAQLGLHQSTISRAVRR